MHGGAHHIGPGQLVAGQYRVEGLVGEGGYGAVYSAVQLYPGLPQGRRVALKVLHPDVLLRQSAIARFTREAQLAQSLAHPNTVRLFDFGQTEAGLPYIVYELLDGKSLERILHEQVRISPRRTARMATQCLKALMEAHGRGIVHRDIKPANIFLCDYPGEPDFVKVLDFGIAASASSDDAKPLTREGASIGTPAYMSPEQVMCEPVDGRSDLYALGLVMAEALAGAPVYTGRNGMQIAMQQVAEVPVPLPEEVTSSPLADVIRRATEKKRDARFASAADMLEAVDRVAMGMQMHLSGTSPSPATHVVLQSPGTPGELLREGSLAAIQEAPTTGMPIPRTGGTGPSSPPRPASGPMGQSPVALSASMPPAWSTGPAHGPPSPLEVAPTALGAMQSPVHGWAASPPATPWTPGQGTSAVPHASSGGHAPYASPGAMPGGPTPGGVRPATLSAAYLPSRAPAKSGRGAVIALVVGAVLVAGSAAAAGAYLWLGAPSGTPSSRSKGSATRGNKEDRATRPVAIEELDGFTIRGVSAQTMLDRMVEEGWTFEAHSEGDPGNALGYRVTYTFERGDDIATLQFCPKAPFGLGMGVGYAVRDDPRSVELTVIEDFDAAKPLMTRLLRKP